ncbi:uncharacterized protein [Saccopteryx bilineata]|uniref:uncharacterized protein n=1 Tax=Saccopteryx bilineata TaxID=59482 RepID=UPI00338F4366
MTAPTKCSGVFLLLLLLLLPSCVRAAPRGKVGAGTSEKDAHCLCLSFTVRSPSEHGQPLYQVHVLLNGKPFLQYDSDSRLFSSLGEKVNGTNALTEIPQMLDVLMKDLRMNLAEMKKQGSLTLWLWCQQEAGRCTGAFVKVIFNGKPVLLFDAIKVTWTNLNSTAGGTQENWEGIKELSKDFRKISYGHCNPWLGEFLEPMEKVREPTELSTPLGPLGEKVNATNACTEFPQTQGERTREHSMNLSDVSLEKNRTRDTPQHSASLSTGSIIGIICIVFTVIFILIVIVYKDICPIQKCLPSAPAPGSPSPPPAQAEKAGAENRDGPDWEEGESEALGTNPQTLTANLSRRPPGAAAAKFYDIGFLERFSSGPLTSFLLEFVGIRKDQSNRLY